MKSKILSIKASSVVCLPGDESDQIIASATCIDVDHLLDQILGYDMQAEVFAYLRENFSQDYLAEELGLGVDGVVKLFTCPRCRSIKTIEQLAINDEMCVLCHVDAMKRELKE